MRKKSLGLLIAETGIGAAALWRMNKHFSQKLEQVQAEANKFHDYFLLLSHWLEIKNRGGNAASYFKDMGFKKIAIYGMGELANRLFEDLQGTDIEIVYGIDREPSSCATSIANVYAPNDELPAVDVIVVTPFSSYDDIESLLIKNTKCPIISIENVIWSV